MTDLRKRMKSFYANSATYRDLLADQSRFRRQLTLERYVSLVAQFAPRKGILLDLGCGTGKTTRTLLSQGYDVVGIDISSLFLNQNQTDSNKLKPKLAAADITRLPFKSSSVGCVAMHDVIEHIPDTDTLLHEVTRVLSRDGLLIIVSPNLLSPIKPVRHILGAEGFNIKFYGSYQKAIWEIFLNTLRVFQKLLSSQPKFIYRDPLLEDFQCPDDDAVYLANPIDLQKWLSARKYSVNFYRFLTDEDSFLERMKSRLLNWLPWLDKGFYLTARRKA